MLCRGHNGQKIVGTFYGKELQKSKPRGGWNRKSNKEKSTKVMIKIEKATIVHSIVGLIRNISLYKMSYFPGSYIW